MKIDSRMVSDQLRMLQGVDPIQRPGSKETMPVGPSDGNQPTFGEFLKVQLVEANNLGLKADRQIQLALEGKEPNPHKTMIAIQKADITFRLLMAVKDKLEQAYQSIIRTQMG